MKKKNVALVILLSLFSCNDDEPTYKLDHRYSWDVESPYMTIPSSVFDQTFQVKDVDGNIGGIVGVATYWYGLNLQNLDDAARVDNTALINDRPSIISDTIQGDWFTVINEENKRLRIILDKNKGTETRNLVMDFLGYNLNTTIKSRIVIVDGLSIQQQPSK